MSFGIKDLVALLEKVPGWKRIATAPDRIDALEKRIAALEAKPHLPICEKCGRGYMRLDRTQPLQGAFGVFSDAGSEVRIYKCDECGMETKKAD